MDAIGLTNDYVKTILERYSYNFIGMNKLAKKLHTKANFSTVHNVDGHFIAIIAHRGEIEYFDPIGLPPLSRKIRRFLATDRRNIYVNSKTIQHPMSVFCGFFVILKVLAVEKSPETKLISFNSKYLERNDNICVLNIIKLMK